MGLPHERKIWSFCKIQGIWKRDVRKNKNEDSVPTLRQWGRIYFERVLWLFVRKWNSKILDMSKYASTKWSIWEKESLPCRNMSKHSTCQVSSKQVLGRIHEGWGVRDQQVPLKRLGSISLFEKLWSVKPTVSHFKVFGCVCYVFVADHLRRKFDKKAIRCIFVG